MKKRNKKWTKGKDYLRLLERLDKNHQAQKDLGWIELDEPIFIGWEAKIKPRKDIQNRDDAWVFWKICEEFSGSIFARKIEDFDWNKKIKPKIYQGPPGIRSIHESIYEKMPSQIQKYFTLDIYSTGKEYKYRFGNWYYCNIPSFFWEVVYEKSYKSKVRVLDEILIQEESEIKSILYDKFYWEYKWCKSAPKHFRNSLNRIQRAKSKEDLRKQINGYDPEWSPNYKNAKWLWW
jgi:hypothetical protein